MIRCMGVPQHLYAWLVPCKCAFILTLCIGVHDCMQDYAPSFNYAWLTHSFLTLIFFTSIFTSVHDWVHERVTYFKFKHLSFSTYILLRVFSSFYLTYCSYLMDDYTLCCSKLVVSWRYITFAWSLGQWL